MINTAFMLLFKDSIRLFAAYNEGVINMLGEPVCRSQVVFMGAEGDQSGSQSLSGPQRNTLT